MKNITKVFFSFVIVASLFIGVGTNLFANNANGGFVLDGLNFDVNFGGGQGGTGHVVDSGGGDDVLEGDKILEGKKGINGNNFDKHDITSLINKKIASLEGIGVTDIHLLDLDGNGIFEIIGKKDGFIHVYKFNGVTYLKGTPLDGEEELDLDHGGIEIFNFKKGNKDDYSIFKLGRESCRKSSKDKDGLIRLGCIDEMKKENKLFDDVIRLKHEQTVNFFWKYITYFTRSVVKENYGKTREVNCYRILGDDTSNKSGKKYVEYRDWLRSKIKYSLIDFNGKKIDEVFENINSGPTCYSSINNDIIIYDKTKSNFYFEDGYLFKVGKNGLYEKYKYEGIKREGFLNVRELKFEGFLGGGSLGGGLNKKEKNIGKNIFKDNGTIIDSTNDQIIITNNNDGTKNYSIVADINGEENVILSEKNMHGAFFEDLDGDGIKEIIFYENFENDKIGQFKRYTIYKYNDGGYSKLLKKKGFDIEILNIFGGKELSLLIQGIDGKLNIYNEKIELINSIQSDETKFVDINNDGNKDILAKIKIKGSRDMGYFQVYLYDGNNKRFNKSLPGKGVIGESINGGIDINEDGISEIEIYKQNGVKIMKYNNDGDGYENIGTGMNIKRGGEGDYIEKNDNKFGNGNTGYITTKNEFRIIGKDFKQKMNVIKFKAFDKKGYCLNSGCKDRVVGKKDYHTINNIANLRHIVFNKESKSFSFNDLDGGKSNLLVSNSGDKLFAITFEGGEGKIDYPELNSKLILTDGNGQAIFLKEDLTGFGFGKLISKGGVNFLFDEDNKKISEFKSPECYDFTTAADGGILFSPKFLDTKLFSEKGYKRLATFNGSVKFHAFLEEKEGKQINNIKFKVQNKEVFSQAHYVEIKYSDYYRYKIANEIKNSNEKEYLEKLSKSLLFSYSCGKNSGKTTLDENDKITISNSTFYVYRSHNATKEEFLKSISSTITAESIKGLTLDELLVKSGKKVYEGKHDLNILFD